VAWTGKGLRHEVFEAGRQLFLWFCYGAVMWVAALFFGYLAALPISARWRLDWRRLGWLLGNALFVCWAAFLVARLALWDRTQPTHLRASYAFCWARRRRMYSRM
jgi:hypothetical protein